MELSEDISFDTSQLSWIREFADKQSQLAKVVGDIAQFRVIIDANIVISDLLQKIKYPERGKTAIEELIHSTVLVVVAPRWLDTDILSAISQTAASRQISEEALHAHWVEYRKMLVWDETYPKPIDTPLTQADPKDAPYVFTQLIQNADGVLSKDSHIAKLGGKQLTLDFVFAVRRYARSAVVAVGIRVNGTMLGFVTIAAIMELAKALVTMFKKLPDGVKLLILAGLVLALVYPDTRTWIFKQFEKSKQKLNPVWVDLVCAFESAASLAHKKDAEAAEQLAEAKSYTAVTDARRDVIP